MSKIWYSLILLLALSACNTENNAAYKDRSFAIYDNTPAISVTIDSHSLNMAGPKNYHSLFSGTADSRQPIISKALAENSPPLGLYIMLENTPAPLSTLGMQYLMIH